MHRPRCPARRRVGVHEFNRAASRRTGEARENAVEGRDRVEGRMTPDQLAEAQRLASEWDEAHPR